MPGAYTHISLATLLTSGNALNNLHLNSIARRALLEYPELCHMGAISPDYPYLNLVGGRGESEHWANAMHHKYGTLTKKNILHAGIDYIRNLTGDEQAQCLAWFFGYASHVTADVTCHPMTNLLVGDYDAGNQTPHRESEMHQDVYIFSSRMGGNIRNSEVIKNVIGACSSLEDNKKVKPFVEKIWRKMLSEAFPELITKFGIDINDWHNSVLFWIDNVGEELSFIPSRHIRNIFEEEGISYPTVVNQTKFIDTLITPNGVQTYDEIFNRALSNVKKVWRLISDGVFEGKTDYVNKLKIWNLDTGQEVKTPKVLWEEGYL